MFDGSGTLFALGLRITKLDASGLPLVGANNAYCTDALVKIELGLEYEDAKEVTQLNGRGVACVNYQAPFTLKRGSIAGLQVCQPDPNLLQFLIGGDTINDTAPTPNQIGYRAPQTGVEELPNGISIEAWSRAVLGSAYARTLPYLHWVFPQCYLTPAGTWALAADAAMLPEFTGYSIQNPAWGSGPENDFDYPSDRVWQYVRENGVPDLSVGLTSVIEQTPPTVESIAVTPAAPSISHTSTIQMTATATMSNFTTQDVTSLATWSSATTADATVNSTGLVTGVAAGSSVITATYETISGNTTVTLT
ncbi:MAG TPA: Ig-like domain-containing protein [Pseudonocardia sp.]|jgi:hypothetical protein